jgi:hypothetical protein
LTKVLRPTPEDKFACRSSLFLLLLGHRPSLTKPIQFQVMTSK